MVGVGSAVTAMGLGDLWDKKKTRKKERLVNNYRLARGQTFKIVEEASHREEAAHRAFKNEGEREGYHVYIQNLSEKHANEEILREQLSLALDTLAAADALRTGTIKENTPKEICDVIERRKMLEERRKKLKLLSWGSSTAIPEMEETPETPLAIEDGVTPETPGDKVLEPPPSITSPSPSTPTLPRAKSLFTYGNATGAESP